MGRVAAARSVSADRFRALVERQSEGRELWVLGEPRVNVPLLNLAMDAQFGRPLAPPPSTAGAPDGGAAEGSAAAPAQPQPDQK